MFTPFAFNLGPTELIIILAILVLLFGASKLPDLARGSGRALRIFKAETKGLGDDDDVKTPEQLEIESRQAKSEQATQEPAPQERRDDTTA